MAETQNVVLDLSKLKKITEQIKKDLSSYTAKIGILQAQQHAAMGGDLDEESTFTNAELGAVHEFGSLDGKIPSRSFLMLTQRTKSKEMSDFITAQQDNIVKRVMAGETKKVLERLAAKWMSYVHECFETEGFGTWKPLRPSTLLAREKKRRYKKQGGVRILQDTGALERSITYEVE